MVDCGPMRDKDRLHKDFTRLMDAGLQMKAVAEQAGVPYTSLRQFRHEGYLGERKMPATSMD